MSALILVTNRRRARRINCRLFRRVCHNLLENLLQRSDFDIAIHFVGDPEIIRLNATYLRHAGSTDVITFDYHDPGLPQRLHAEIFLCVDEAQRQARKFRVHWTDELVRYAVHGILHLCDYDDQSKARRRKMKAAENRLLRSLRSAFGFRQIAR